MGESTPPLASAEHDRLVRLARSLQANEPALSRTDVLGPGVGAGMGAGPAVVIGDHREISLAPAGASELFEYRLSLLAAPGDVLLVSGNRNAAFEAYRESALGLGPLDVVELPEERNGGMTPLARRCRDERCAMEHIAAIARRSGELTVMPNIGTGNAWVLAAALAELSGVAVHVAAPPPRLTRRVNDRIWFARRVREVLGPRGRPPLRAAYGPAALAAHVAAMARRSERVAVKVPDSAGSVGNISLASRDVAALPLDVLRERLLALLGGLGWRDRFPLLVEVWDCPVLSNPSVQLWLPCVADGAPVMEGVFEQVVAGAEGRFVGSVPAAFCEDWIDRIVREAGRIATLLQCLGYFGRCSFDAVIAGVDYAGADLHWIECNARWGGVSIPMTLANRLAGDWRRRPFVVAQRTDLVLGTNRFADALDLLGNRLFVAGERDQGIVLFNPLGIERGTAVYLMALAPELETAKRLSVEAIRMLSRRS